MTTYSDVMSDYMTINMPDGAGSSSGGTNVNIGENLNLKGDRALKNPVIAEYVWIVVMVNLCGQSVKHYLRYPIIT